MTVDLEGRLRASLHREAARAPLRAPEWEPRPSGPATVTKRPWVAVAASVALVGGGVVAVVALQRSDPVAVRTVPYTPEGDEYPLTVIDPTTIEHLPSFFDSDFVKPGSVVVAEANGDSVFVYVGMLTPARGDRVTQSRCLSDLASGSDWCVLFVDPVPIVVPRFSGSGELDTFAWTNVPDSADFVQYRDGDTVLWQRPSGGLAMFPVFAGTEAEVVAFDRDGRVVAEIDSPTVVDWWVSARPVLADNLSGADNRRVAIAANDAMASCMADAGIGDPLGPSNTESLEAWDRCIAAAQAAATQKFDELGGELVENPEEDPSYVPAATAPPP